MTYPCTREYPHSHDWRDVRYIGKLVFNKSICPIIVLDPAETGNYMRPGETYLCIECGSEIHIGSDGVATQH